MRTDTRGGMEARECRTLVAIPSRHVGAAPVLAARSAASRRSCASGGRDGWLLAGVHREPRRFQLSGRGRKPALQVRRAAIGLPRVLAGGRLAALRAVPAPDRAAASA